MGTNIYLTMARKLTSRQIDAICREVQSKLRDIYKEAYNKEVDKLLETPLATEVLELLIKINEKVYGNDSTPEDFINFNGRNVHTNLIRIFSDFKSRNVSIHEAKFINYPRIYDSVVLMDMNETINMEEWINSLVEKFK